MITSSCWVNGVSVFGGFEFSFVFKEVEDGLGRHSFTATGVEGGVGTKFIDDSGEEYFVGVRVAFHHIEDGVCVMVHIYIVIVLMEIRILISRE